MSDLLDRIRRELNDRVAELKPVADELARLQRAADALDHATPAAGATRPASSPRRPPRTQRAQPPRRRAAGRTASERAAPGQTQQRVIDQLRGAPGSSSTAVAQALGISANAAAATISRLVKQDRVRRLQSGGYEAAPAAPAAAPADADAAAPAPDPSTGSGST